MVLAHELLYYFEMMKYLLTFAQWCFLEGPLKN